MGAGEGKEGKRVRKLQKFEVMDCEYSLDREGSEAENL